MKFKQRFFDLGELQANHLVRLFTVMAVSAAFLVGYLIHMGSVTSAQAKSYAGYTMKSAKLYGALISSQLDDKVLTEKTIIFILESNEDIEDIFIVNKFAGVIAPVSKAYDVIRDDELDEILLAKPELGVQATVQQNVNTGKTYFPVLNDDNSIKAVIVMNFAMNTHYVLDQRLGTFILCYLLALTCVVLLSAKLIVLLEKPWQELAQEVEGALQGEPLSNPSSTDKSLVGLHHFLYFRLLSKLRLSNSDAEK